MSAPKSETYPVNGKEMRSLAGERDRLTPGKITHIVTIEMTVLLDDDRTEPQVFISSLAKRLLRPKDVSKVKITAYPLDRARHVSSVRGKL